MHYRVYLILLYFGISECGRARIYAVNLESTKCLVNMIDHVANVTRHAPCVPLEFHLPVFHSNPLVPR